MRRPDQTDNDAAPQLNQAIARSKQGDVRAFRQVVETYQQYAFSLAFRIVCDHDDARDVVQETFVRVWKHIGSFDPETRFTTWLYKIVVNLSYDRLKGEGRRKRIFAMWPEAGAESFEDKRSPIDADLINRDLAEKIKAIAEGLPVKQRMVFVLRDLQDLTVDEVSEILEMSRESVKTNLCYARRQIRLRLERLEVKG